MEFSTIPNKVSATINTALNNKRLLYSSSMVRYPEFGIVHASVPALIYKPVKITLKIKNKANIIYARIKENLKYQNYYSFIFGFCIGIAIPLIGYLLKLIFFYK